MQSIIRNTENVLPYQLLIFDLPHVLGEGWFQADAPCIVSKEATTRFLGN